MAGSTTFLINLEQKCVAVAVVIRLAHKLAITTGVTLAPQLTTATAVVDHAPFSKSHAERFCIHPRHHQDVTRINTLRNRGHQTICVVDHTGQLIGSGKNDAPS